MSNYKKIWIALCALFLWSCKAGLYNFSYQGNVNLNFISNIVSMSDYDEIKIDSARVYRATLTERLVERDHVTELSLLNTESTQERVGLGVFANSHYLYFFELYPHSGRDTLIMYLPTSISALNLCNKAGPVYFGVRRFSRLRFQETFKISRKGRISRSHKINIQFYNDGRFPVAGNTTSSLHISQIIRDESNKIGGSKALIFSTKNVFGDAEALVFRYYGMIK